MKKFKILLGLILVLTLVGCSSSGSTIGGAVPPQKPEAGDADNNEYLELREQNFISTVADNIVNVSLDSSNAAYSNLRKLINNLQPIPTDAVNIEQMLNYFTYSYENDSEDQLKSYLEVARCPWNDENYLLSVAVKAKEFQLEENRPNNFVFLLDISGSMYAEDRLPLMIKAFKILVDNLKDNDRVSIVTYAGTESILLDGAYGFEKAKISAIISDLSAGGSTAGSKGIQRAYDLAQKHYIEGGNNRVFLATDGDFNVGLSKIGDLKKFISEKRQTGVYLSLFGFGTGNLKADTMDTLAQAGNGNYYYIDSLLEAQKVFITELGGTLQTVAKDAKVQVEFNKEIVEKYRLIGYENKQLTDEEFDNSETDAGEIGAGHVTVCLIEITLKDLVDDAEIVRCTVRYKDALDNELNKEAITICNGITANPSSEFLFQSAVAEFGLVLRNSKYKHNASLPKVVSRIVDNKLDSDDYRREFLRLVLKYMNDYVRR